MAIVRLNRGQSVYLPVPLRKRPDRYSSVVKSDYLPNFSPYGPGMGDVDENGLGDGTGISFVDSTVSKVVGQLDDISMAIKICMVASVVAGLASLTLLLGGKR